MRAAVLLILTTIGAVALAAVALAGGSTGGDDLPTRPPASLLETSTATRTPAEAATRDAQAYAERFGVTVAEARQRLSRQEGLGEALDRLEQRFPGTYAGGWIEHVPAFRAVARFVGAVPPEAAELAGPGVVLRPNAPRPLAQLDALADRVFDETADAFRTRVAAGVDVKNGVVELSVETPAALRGLTDAELRSRLPQSARTPAVRVEFSDKQLTVNDHSYGGAWLVLGGSPSCTSGFGVFDLPNGETGLLTAGHCSNDYDYRPPDGSADYDTDWVDGHRGDWGDFQWHTTDDHGDFPEFYDSDDDRREVFGFRDNISNGDFFCKYGRTTDYDCSTVRDKKFSVTDEDGFRLKKMVQMEDEVTSSGDSGGPWFINGDAVGIHSGRVLKGGDMRSFFSWIVYADDAVGVGLLVS
jgi:hypothetical protein